MTASKNEVTQFLQVSFNNLVFKPIHLIGKEQQQIGRRDADALLERRAAGGAARAADARYGRAAVGAEEARRAERALAGEVRNHPAVVAGEAGAGGLGGEPVGVGVCGALVGHAGPGLDGLARGVVALAGAHAAGVAGESLLHAGLAVEARRAPAVGELGPG